MDSAMEDKSSKSLDVHEEQRQRYDRSGSLRYILCGSLLINCFLLYAMRLNLSVSITAMVNSTDVQNETFSNESCRDPNFVENKTATGTASKGEFHWDQSEQAMITYAFFVGYLLSQVPGGYLAQTYSLTWVMGLGVGLTSVFTCLTAAAARAGLPTLVALRALEGLCEGVTFPALFVFMSKWVPIQEQGFLLSIIFAGANVGTVVTMPVSALLCASAWGWPASFYVPGILGIVSSLLWFLVAADGPEHHRWVSTAERNYILHNRPSVRDKPSTSVPWKAMLMSPAVWFLLLERLGVSLNYFMILTELPSYLKYMFGINIVKNGVINGSMIMGLSISLVICGWIADKILAEKLVSKNLVRKSFVTITCLVPSLCMMIVPQVGCSYRVVLALIFVNCICLGSSGGGDSLLCLDIAPRYAGALQGVLGSVSALAGVLAPLSVGLATEKNNTLHQWNLVFYCIGILGAAGATLFVIFGSTEEQSWAKDQSDEDGKPLRID